MDKKYLDNLIADMQQKSDENAFAEFYSLTKNGLYSFLLAILKDRAKTEDIMQDTYIKFRLGIQSYKTGTNPTAFLMQIGKRLAFNELRKGIRETDTDYAIWDMPDKSPDISESTDTTVLDAIKKYLSRDEAQIVMLHVVSGYKHREIAALLEKPLGTVIWSYNNSIKKLKKILREVNDEI